ncbi:MAG: RNA-binding protein [Gammaproteobacteria bacterium]|nr:RNA-binding protein [Gammaproteobacteria bacterium]
MKKLYVGNLPWSTTEADLEEMFSSYGTVHSAAVVTDRDTGRSRGFGFIEIDASGADKAIEELNGSDVGGRQLRVNEAQDKRRGGGGGGGGGGGDGGRW